MARSGTDLNRALRHLAAVVVLAASTASTHVALERADGPPAPSGPAEVDPPTGVDSPWLRSEVAGTVDALDGRGLGATRDEVSLVADGAPGPAPRPRLELVDVLVDGARRNIVWNGDGQLRLAGHGAMRSDAIEVTVVDGAAALSTPAASITIDAGPFTLVGTVEIVDRKAAGGVLRPSLTVDRIDVIVEAASSVRGQGTIRVEATGPITLDLDTPVAVRGTFAILENRAPAPSAAGAGRRGGVDRLVIRSGDVRLEIPTQGRPRIGASGAIDRGRPSD